MPKHSIPDRWLDYKSIGHAIEGTRFIPFKVPLKQHIHEVNHISEDQVFTPSQLFEGVKEQQLKLGLVIDLTFTTRYYDNEEITSNNVKYEKVFTAGKQVPDRRTVNRFTEVVKEFEEENTDNDLLIGVHCTHGVNRTGYLICRYMIEHLKFTPDDALKAYEKARGYPVERTNYVEDLKTRPREDGDSDDDLSSSPSPPHRQTYYHGRQRNDWTKGEQNWTKSRPDRSRYQPYSTQHKRNYSDNHYEDYNDRYYGSHRWSDFRYQDESYRESYYSSGQHWDQWRIQGDERPTNYYDQNASGYYTDSRRRRNESLNSGRQYEQDKYPSSRPRYKWTKKTKY